MNNSNTIIDSGAIRVEGALANDSYLWMNDVDDIDIKKDDLSRLTMNYGKLFNNSCNKFV